MKPAQPAGISESELLPCPHCGGDAKVHWGSVSARSVAAVYCQSCWCQSPERLDDAAAITAWNRRAAENSANVTIKKKPTQAYVMGYRAAERRCAERVEKAQDKVNEIAFQCLQEGTINCELRMRIAKLRDALEDIKKHKETLVPGMYQLTTSWTIANRALAEDTVNTAGGEDV